MNEMRGSVQGSSNAGAQIAVVRCWIMQSGASKAVMAGCGSVTDGARVKTGMKVWLAEKGRKGVITIQ